MHAPSPGSFRRRARLAMGAVASATLLAASLTTGTAAASPVAAAPHPARPHYYLSLGDSLAAGYQPDARGNVPGVSYTDQLYARLKQRDPSLVHVQLGCSGETTTTMIDGGICSYPGAASQLAAATSFLRHHRGQVTTVTLDIGANDVDGCFASGSIDAGCVAKGLGEVATDLPRITRELRAAGAAFPRYVGMTYYDPFLAAWLEGSAGQRDAALSVPLADTFNGVIAAAMRLHGFRVADVSGAFSTNEFTPTVAVPGFGPLPKNVAEICLLTWMCTPYEDIHANRAGHAVIAGVFDDTLAGYRRP
ncbi:SGNH/GDSL hydrolase family protein [Streptomyces sp. RB6PN25]|uniref:SGNH/GDSL hydrolase family protein n=1 Tax=Streptomyces humicola TaxID=2953240 RepID=A0ABT1PQU8_9ACTN|nr:SGNH/GDSL hydrolase family protein [Streptomyces humicola]MCQ4080037.1 SGNH/GDSL hydrolase family protein [Streptomyces humicola]